MKKILAIYVLFCLGVCVAESVDEACERLRKLSWTAGVEAVPELIKAQSADPRVADMALYVFQRIRDAEADKMLLAAYPQIPAERHPMICEVLGKKHVVEACPVLKQALNEKGCTSAASIALGRIGTKEALDALTDFLPKAAQEARRDVLSGMVNCLYHLQPQDCAAASDAMLAATDALPHQKACAFAVRCENRGDESIADIVEALRKGDEAMMNVIPKLLESRHIPNALTKVATEWKTFPKNRAVVVFQMVGRTADKRYEDVLLNVMAAEKEHEQLRLSAVNALETCGTEKCVIPLATLATTTEHGCQSSRRVLTRMKSEPVGAIDAAMIVMAADEKRPAAVRAVLVGVLGQRHYRPSFPLLLNSVVDKDDAIRREAIAALSMIAVETDYPMVIDLLCKAQKSADRNRLATLAVTLGHQMKDGDATAKILLDAMAQGDTSVKISLIGVMGKLGLPTTLPEIVKSLDSQEDAMKRVAILALTEWPTAEPLTALRQASRNENNNLALRVLALRGYAQLLALPSNRKIDETIAMYKEAMELATGVAEKVSIISGIGQLAHPEALKLVRTYLENNELKESASAAEQTILKNLKDNRVAALTASHGDGSMKLAIDGKRNSRWSIGRRQAGGEWFQIDMGIAKPLQTIDIDAGDEGEDFPGALDVMVSNDGKDWMKLISMECSTRQYKIPMNGTYTRYVKLVLTKPRQRFWSICEMKVELVPVAE
ncbi:MAG: discoidin domain-containing protein [Victivallales bacterium]|nr:discoidin domain-containing protein [Victivallales bacterium]